MSSKYSVAIVLSLFLHGVLAAILLANVNFSDNEVPKPAPMQMTAIEAVTVDKTKLDQQVKRLQKEKADQKAAEEKRIRDLERRAAEAESARNREEARIKRLEKQRKQKEQEKRKAESAAEVSRREAAKADKLRKQKELEKQKAEDAARAAKQRRLKEEQAAKKAEELRKKKEVDRKRAEQAAREKAAQEKALAEQMAAEMAVRSKARRQQVMTEVQKYQAIIYQTIKRFLITDSSTMSGKSCNLRISLAGSGFVKNVVAVKGDKVVCDAAVTAVYKAGTLPVSKDPEVFKEMAEIDLIVAPEF